MAEARRLFPLTACVDHLNTTYEEAYRKWLAANRNFRRERFSAFRELATLSATTCNFKSEKSLEERQSDVARIREKHPDTIPVIILRAEECFMPYPRRKKLLIPAKSNLRAFFTMIWNVVYSYNSGSRSYSLVIIPEHWNPILKKLMSSVYEEYKDEDGCLYITLSGDREVLRDSPVPSDINVWTFYLASR
ncbi:autophagy-related protein 8f-like [Apium graveolens]|uniref:autophagy-related protein 8f-like n=1 Tax=Apium graveolens TaxID=4045 RepID=UPI003D7B16EA